MTEPDDRMYSVAVQKWDEAREEVRRLRAEVARLRSMVDAAAEAARGRVASLAPTVLAASLALYREEGPGGREAWYAAMAPYHDAVLALAALEAGDGREER